MDKRIMFCITLAAVLIGLSLPLQGQELTPAGKQAINTAAIARILGTKATV